MKFLQNFENFSKKFFGHRGCLSGQLTLKVCSFDRLRSDKSIPSSQIFSIDFISEHEEQNVEKKFENFAKTTILGVNGPVLGKFESDEAQTQ